MKHTNPAIGPWIAQQSGGLLAGWVVREPGTPPRTITMLLDEREARLIATAPELLQAVRLALTILDDVPGAQPFTDKMLQSCRTTLRRVIREATGEEL